MTTRNRNSQHKIISSALHPFHGAFGSDTFGRRAELFARMFGTPEFLIGQTVVVGAWIAINVLVVALRWDPYPFILLNLAFSLQAAYAAPLILLAQTRQADRDKAINEADTKHREELAAETIEYLESANRHGEALRHLLDLNTRLTEEINRLTVEIHRSVTAE
jgi:uncharacterized membrane protein